MAIKAPVSSNKAFVIASEGNHVARVYSIVEIGEITDTWEGEDRQVRKLRIGWELPNEVHVFNEEKGEQPLAVFQEYTISLNSKAKLRKIVEGILGKTLNKEEEENFSIESLLGKPCMLQVTQKVSMTSGNPYCVVVGTGSIPKGMTVPEPVNQPMTLDYENWNQEVFDTLPTFVQERMMASTEYNARLK